MAAAPVSPPAAAREPQANPPQRAAGLELLGRFEGSGFRDAPYLARRRDGQVIQLSRLLYLVADAADGRTDAEAIAARVGPRIGRRVSARNIDFLVERKLRPLGVLAAGDGSTPELAKQPPLLALHHRRPLIPPRAVQTLGLAFAPVFATPIVAIVLAALVAFDVWLFGMHGIAQGLRTVLYEPTLLLALILCVIAATAFHEIGHAAACRYGGGRPGAIGAGLYLVWPAFYCDVTDAYRLDRRGRLRTDLGGIYFNAITALLAGGAYFATGHEWLLLLAVVQHLTMLQQLLPLLRFDGYYVLTDLTGVPDIIARIGPILRSLVPFRPVEPKVRELKPWVRLVVTSYVVVLVPLLLLILTWMVMGAPRIFATAFDSVGLHAERVAETLRRGEWSVTALSSLQILLLVLQCAGIVLILSRAGRSAARRLWRWSSGSAPRTAVVLSGTAVVAALVVATWWPDGDYQPLRPGERGTVPEAVSELHEVSGDRVAYGVAAEPSAGPVLGAAVEPADAADGDGAPPAGAPSDPDSAADDSQQPEPDPAPVAEATPDETVEQTPTTAAVPPPTSPGAPTPIPASSKDNAAVATNTVDGALVFRLAFDLRFILDGAIDHSNSAVAYASCNGCRTIAIAIQILIAMGEFQTIAPTNTAVAFNNRCPSCETLAYAYQLIFALPDLRHLTQEGRTKIANILAAVVVLGSSDTPIHEVQTQLDALMDDLRDTVATELEPTEGSEEASPQEQPPTQEDTSTSEPEQTATPSPSATPEATPPPASGPSAPPVSGPSPTPSPEPIPTPTATSTPTPTPTPESSATPTPTP